MRSIILRIIGSPAPYGRAIAKGVNQIQNRTWGPEFLLSRAALRLSATVRATKANAVYQKRITASLGFRSADGACRTIEAYEAMHVILEDVVVLDAAALFDGIEPSDDPLLELRAAIYLISGCRRRRQATERQARTSQTV